MWPDRNLSDYIEANTLKKYSVSELKEWVLTLDQKFNDVPDQLLVWARTEEPSISQVCIWCGCDIEGDLDAHEESCTE